MVSSRVLGLSGRAGGLALLCGTLAVSAALATPGTPGGGVSGSVLYGPDGPGIARVDVGAYRGDRLLGHALSGRGGLFHIGHLPPGRYLVYFFPQAGNGVPAWYPDVPDRAAARAVVVRGGHDTHLAPERLARGATISGRVLVTPGHAGHPVTVDLFSDATVAPYILRSTTVPDGRAYTISGIPAGRYLVSFEAGPLAAWYAGPRRPSVGSVAHATAVTLRAPLSRGGVNGAPVAHPPGYSGAASGVVTSAGRGVPGATVTAYARVVRPGSPARLRFAGRTRTGPTGDYTLLGLRPGLRYAFRFSRSGFMTAWNGDAAAPIRFVDVGAETILTGVDGVLLRR